MKTPNDKQSSFSIASEIGLKINGSLTSTYIHFINSDKNVELRLKTKEFIESDQCKQAM